MAVCSMGRSISRRLTTARGYSLVFSPVSISSTLQIRLTTNNGDHSGSPQSGSTLRLGRTLSALTTNTESKQRTPQYRRREREIDDEPRYVNQGGNKRG